MRALCWTAMTLAAATTSGCLVEEVPHTLVTVRIEAPRLNDLPHRVRVRVYRGRFESPPVRDCFREVVFTDGREPAASIEVPVQPTDNENPTEFSIEAELVLGADNVPEAWQRAIIAYVPDRQVEVRLPLTSRCADTPCRNDQTCVDGACVSACFAPDASGELVRGACTGPAGDLDACARFPARVHGAPAPDGSMPAGEAFCGAMSDGVCYCDDPPGCIASDGAASCCRTRPVCEPGGACVWARQRVDGSCPNELVVCPAGGRCVGARTIEQCCGPGTTACFGG